MILNDLNRFGLEKLINRFLAVISFAALVDCATPLAHPSGEFPYTTAWIVATIASAGLIFAIVQRPHGGLAACSRGGDSWIVRILSSLACCARRH